MREIRGALIPQMRLLVHTLTADVIILRPMTPLQLTRDDAPLTTTLTTNHPHTTLLNTPTSNTKDVYNSIDIWTQ